MSEIKIIECPRDAMQGIKTFIPTEKKIDYLQTLLSIGFDTLDFGSFVSEKAIPQMRDTKEVIEALDITQTETKLLAIIANYRGAEEAVKHDKISYLGYPFSISEIFQMRNTGNTILGALTDLTFIRELANYHQKELVIYLSMGFGNPYGDPWSERIVLNWVEKLFSLGFKTISLSDTVGSASPEIIGTLFSKLIPTFPDIEFGAHLHTLPHQYYEKVDAAYQNGCRRFDGAIKGFGGCPMAKDELTGNMPTEMMLSYFEKNQINTGIDNILFEKAIDKSLTIF
jgi:hydroxymethylglutaryl-CoA lyase